MEIKDFAYIVSHDFRAPLINIKGFAGELKTAIEAVRPAVQIGLPRLNDKQKSQALSALAEDIPEALEFINSSISRLDNLINAVLDLSRLERRELCYEPLNMDLLVNETLKSLSYQLTMANAKVSVGKLPECVADRLAMEQIMTNLLGNAMKFRDLVRPQLVSITGHQFPHETMFIVRDQGRGVESAYLSQIFQIFNRGSGQDVPGEGMGLAYVRALVRRHGGRIWCESQLGRGSTFTFTVSNHLAKRPPDEQS
jgi:signal transduction histidine kinase